MPRGRNRRSAGHGRGNGNHRLLIGAALLGILFMIVGLFLPVLSGLPVQSIFAPTGWSYRKSHVLVGAGAAGQNYPIMFTVHFGSGTDSGQDIYMNAHSRGDFGDVRWTDAAGNVIPFWIETYTTGATATFWVNVGASLSGGSSPTVYIYYGNPGVATTSDGQSVFPIFDDFSGSSLDSTKWATASISTSVAGGMLSAVNPAGAEGALLSKTASSGGMAIEASVHQSGAGSDWGIVARWGPIGAVQGYLFRASGQDGAGTVTIWRAQWAQLRSLSGVSLPNWMAGYNIMSAYLEGTSLSLAINRGARLATVADGAYASGGSGFRIVGGTSISIDWIYVRPWTAVEPSHGAWGAEEMLASQDFTVSAGAILLNINQNATGTNTYTVSLVSGAPKPVTLACTGMPASISCGFHPASGTPPFNGTVSVAVASNAVVGDYTAALRASDGKTSKSASFVIHVTEMTLPFDFSLSSGSMNLTAVAGTSTAATVSVVKIQGIGQDVVLTASTASGVNATFSPIHATPTFASALSLAVAATVPAGAYKITVQGTSQSKQHSTTLNLLVTAPVSNGHSCPVGSSWDEGRQQCVPAGDVSVWCPTGSQWDGTQCVGMSAPAPPQPQAGGTSATSTGATDTDMTASRIILIVMGLGSMVAGVVPRRIG